MGQVCPIGLKNLLGLLYLSIDRLPTLFARTVVSERQVNPLAGKIPATSARTRSSRRPDRTSDANRAGDPPCGIDSSVRR